MTFDEFLVSKETIGPLTNLKNPFQYDSKKTKPIDKVLKVNPIVIKTHNGIATTPESEKEIET